MLRIGPSDLSAIGRRHSPYPDRQSGGPCPPPPQGGSPAQARLLVELERRHLQDLAGVMNGLFTTSAETQMVHVPKTGRLVDW